MEEVKWSAALSIGVEAVDGQHKQLFAIVRELQDAIVLGKGQKRMHMLLEKLIVYTETHFRDEEAYMDKIGYPAMESHRHEHEQLVQKVRRFQRRLEMERISMPVLEFLINWVGHHIMTSDQEIGRYARGLPGVE
ncbi:MAG: bacteriohemerythrin, partial [bacterium]|nr:bacteriohemerythrin [bacterium]